MQNILIIEDDISSAGITKQVIENKLNYKAMIANCGMVAQNLLAMHAGNISMVILDINLPDINGLKLINEIKKYNKNCACIIYSGDQAGSSVVEAMKLGASDYICKLQGVKKLTEKIAELSISNDIEKTEIKIANLPLRNRNNIDFDDILGGSPAIKDVINLGKKVAKSNISVLIEGMSGAGKEFLARAIHNQSAGKNNAFVAVNCGAIPENLVETIFFGHQKGAFTGAIATTLGKFREADGGTLFLDEISELKPDMQVKLLRVLQERVINPVGSKDEIHVNVRIISATNKDLSEEVKKGSFREDLYYRLNVFPIYVPKLSQRKSDIEILVRDFIKKFNETEFKNIKNIDEDALKLLKQYDWPGNIRELKNTIYRAVVLAEKEILTIDDFTYVSSKLSCKSDEYVTEELLYKNLVNFLQLEDKSGQMKSLQEIEKEIIIKTLQHYNDHISKTSDILKISRSTLYRKINDYKINIPTDKNDKK